ncbi:MULTISPECIES: alpha/beta fold hydrolase [Prochlorococcus]|uniref:alpha/beta fold hydrolase n=1 Tax=Prochlorococcus TaxID=1218 RepID=UPI001F4CA6A6|nr:MULTISPECIES: alpha/beta hydrolase [Prochlorococcus]
MKSLLLDPLAKELAAKVEWVELKNISLESEEPYPVVITGKGSPVLLIHGFDSCFLEYRRLVPYLENSHQLIIPDLYGFGFSPRPKNSEFDKKKIIFHLNQVIENITSKSQIGIIGASMGGGIAMELARQKHSKINRLMLLSPAGLTGNPKPIPKPFDRLGVCILRNKYVRKQLCMKAFADPKKSVGEAEEQIASIHIKASGWARSLSAFARSGGIANCGSPLPKQPISILWGKEDRILGRKEKEAVKKLINCQHEEIKNCGHLPHLDAPQYVAKTWLN